MGIRFYCPNGHRLNVKAFLAGKRGICPQCGVKVQIPTQSTLEPAKKGRFGKSVAGAEESDDRLTGALSGSESEPPGEVEPVASLGIPDQSAGGKDSSDVEPDTPPELPRAKPLPNDLLDEAPDAVWYVRISDGEQYGPADAGVMRQWVGEGRIGGDCLVWREGWRDWRDALEVFPSLRDGLMPEIEAGGPLSGRSEAGGRTGSAEYSGSSRSRATNRRTVVITILLLAVVLGSVILAWMLLK